MNNWKIYLQEFIDASSSWDEVLSGTSGNNVTIEIKRNGIRCYFHMEFTSWQRGEYLNGIENNPGAHSSKSGMVLLEQTSIRRI